ncbi:hypothetical protein ACFE04_019546 [Oxalis oulophora]
MRDLLTPHLTPLVSKSFNGQDSSFKIIQSYSCAISSKLLGSNKSRSSRSLGCSPMNSASLLRSPCTDNRIVLYFTSLRGIHKTYEDFCEVWIIFRGCRVSVDERDIWMDSSYKKELQSLLGVKAISLYAVYYFDL